MKKKILSLVLALVFVLALVPASIGGDSTPFYYPLPGDSFHVYAEGNSLVFCDMPYNAVPAPLDFIGDVTISLQDEKDSVVDHQAFSLRAGNKAVYNLQNIADGVYYVQLYYLTEYEAAGASWRSAGYIWGKTLPIVVINHTAKFGRSLGNGYEILIDGAWTLVDAGFNPVVLTGSPRDTTLVIDEYYSSFPRWAQPITACLVKNADNSITSVVASSQDEAVLVNTCDTFGQALLEIPFELPLFGGFFSGEKYNFIVFGARNTEQDDNKEVIRIVKYDKKFNRLGSASVTGGSAHTRIPFNAGCPGIAENNDTLILHTSRERYTSSDGLNHQSNLTIELNTETMTVTYTSPVFPQNHVSHSFNQFVLFDEDTPVYLDHGDAFPRTVVLQKGAQEKDASWPELHNATMFDIPGAIGANCTGVTVGGFTVSERNYLAAITTIDHSKVSQYTSFEMIGLDVDQRDILVCAVPRGFQNGAAAERITIKRYVGTNTIGSTPRLISNGDDTFTLVWREFSLDHHVPGDYVARVINGDGQPIGQERRFDDIKTYYREFFNISALPGDPDPLDTASDWARPNITAAIEKGFVPADIRDNYKSTITRAEFCRMAVMWLEYRLGESIDAIVAERGYPERMEHTFTDTDDPNILAAYRLGVTSGTDKPGIFNPNGQFTRQEAATMIMNTCKAAGFDVTGIPPADFKDLDSVPLWAQPGVNFVRANLIMSGDGTNFNPTEQYSREQSIITFNNIK